MNSHIIFVLVEAVLLAGAYVLPSVPPVIAQIMFWGAIAGLVLYPGWVGANWFRQHYRLTSPIVRRDSDKPSTSQVRKLTMLELLSIAEKQFAWSLSAVEFLDLLHGLRQGGSDGQIRFWGRSNRNTFEQLTKNEVLVPIEPDHWRDYDFDVWKALASDDNFYMWTLNKRQNDIKVGGYADVHVDRDAALKWLAQDANQFRGRTESRSDGRE